jgi:hypothetical protein
MRKRRGRPEVLHSPASAVGVGGGKGQRMIRKSVKRFSEKIMLNQESGAHGAR